VIDTRIDNAIREIANTRSCSIAEARRWLREEIDRIRRLRSRSGSREDGMGGKNLKLDNPHRYVQNGTEIPTSTRQGVKVKGVRHGVPRHDYRAGTRGTMKGKQPQPGTVTAYVYDLAHRFECDRTKIMDEMYAHPVYGQKSRRWMSNQITNVFTRWDLKPPYEA
jgi:hypothetical protein